MKLILKGIKRAYGRFSSQAVARHNLHFILRDRRAFAPQLNRTLVDAALTWAPVLPWRPNTILDIGAYTGHVAEQLTSLYRPDFIGLVEPLPDLASELACKSLAPSQKVFACAVGRDEGIATLNVIASRHSSSLLPIAPHCDVLFHTPMHQIGTIQVPVRRLDSILDECGLDSLDLLKIDVQGYELEAFAGGARTLSRTRVIVSEASFFEHYEGQPLFADLYEYLTDVGFQLRGTFAWSYDSSEMPLQCDAVFIRKQAED